jgi:CubicO group peptidase (beta-lactamase class C family)
MSKPGSTFHYNTGETDLVGVLVSNAVGKSLSEYTSDELWQAYGIEREAVWPVDEAGHECGGRCLAMTLGDRRQLGMAHCRGPRARRRAPSLPRCCARRGEGLVGRCVPLAKVNADQEQELAARFQSAAS